MASWNSCRKDTLADVLDVSAAEFPDKPCFVLDHRPVTFDELRRRSNSWAARLLELGVGHGDRVACFVGNCPEIVYSWLACAQIGAVHVPLNTALHGDFLLHQLATSSPSAMLVDASRLATVLQVARGVPSLRHVIVRDDEATPQTGAIDSLGGLVRHAAADLLAGPDLEAPTDRRPRFDDLNAIFFTSGTTGPSKGAAMSHNYIVHIARSLARNLKVDADSTWYQPSALFHINAALTVVLTPILVGATGCSDVRFSASRYWDTVRGYGATHISFLTFGVMLWKQPVRDDDADNPVRLASGTAIPRELHEPLERRFDLKIIKQYALSESCASPLGSTADAPAPPGTSGAASPDYDIALLDEDDDEVPVGVAGEIAIRPRSPYTMFSGYFNNDGATVAAWRNGWFHTGDLAKVDEHGWYTFMDRRKDYIRRRGENISSYELEGVLQGFDGVAEVAVHGVPSELGEDEVKACLVLEPDTALDHTVFIGYCELKLPRYAVPRYVEVLASLPRNQTGRVIKGELKERGVTPETWDREQTDGS
ncbi:MAG TPA: AMP-binding protein [Pseudonocardia sp.]|jgi:crotonobetaine/carnitine-CoA ligase|nr:AMP-binding protein [Pseudonocardia sp.]